MEARATRNMAMIHQPREFTAALGLCLNALGTSGACSHLSQEQRCVCRRAAFTTCHVFAWVCCRRRKYNVLLKTVRRTSSQQLPTLYTYSTYAMRWSTSVGGPIQRNTWSNDMYVARWPQALTTYNMYICMHCIYTPLYVCHTLASRTSFVW